MTVWISPGADESIEDVVDNNIEQIEESLSACGLENSCTGATARWAQVFAKEGFAVRVVTDGVFRDWGGGVGHDWVEVQNGPNWIIIDGAVDQFEREPNGHLYSGGNRTRFADLTEAEREIIFPGEYWS